MNESQGGIGAMSNNGRCSGSLRKLDYIGATLTTHVSESLKRHGFKDFQ